MIFDMFEIFDTICKCLLDHGSSPFFFFLFNFTCLFFLSVLRIGKAKRYLGSYVDAKKYLEKALRRDPENVEVGEELVTNFNCLQLPNTR